MPCTFKHFISKSKLQLNSFCDVYQDMDEIFLKILMNIKASIYEHNEPCGFSFVDNSTGNYINSHQRI